MGKIYKNDVGTEVIIDMQQDISTATSITINVTKPDSTTTVWTPTIYNVNFLRYTIVSGDLSQSGTYKLQPHLTISGWTGSATPIQIVSHSLI